MNVEVEVGVVVVVVRVVVVVGVVDVGDGADLSLATVLGTEPGTLKPDHVGPEVFVEPRSESFSFEIKISFSVKEGKTVKLKEDLIGRIDMV